MTHDANGDYAEANSRSPAIGLLHELAHAWLTTFPDDQYLNLGEALERKKLGKPWRDENEQFVIQEIENPTILESGEATVGRPGWTTPAFSYETISPVSKTPIPGGRNGKGVEKK